MRAFRTVLGLVVVVAALVGIRAGLIRWGVLPRPGEVAVVWTESNGAKTGGAGTTLRRGWIPADVLDAFRADQAELTTAACRGLEAETQQVAKENLTPVFSTVTARVPDYGEWLFGWTPSYGRDRTLLSTAIGTAYEQVQKTELAEVWPVVQHELQEIIRNAFRSQVLPHEQVDPLLAQAWTKTVSRAAEAQTGLAVGQEQAMGRFLGAKTRPLRRPLWAPQPSTHILVAPALTVPTGEPTNQERAPGAADILATIDDPANAALLRAPRPYLARGIGIGLRSAAGLSTLNVTRMVMDVTDLGLIAVLPGLGLGFGWAMLTAAGLDFAISSADEVLNRKDFEAELTQTLLRAQDRMSQDWARRLLPHASVCAY